MREKNAKFKKLPVCPNKFSHQTSLCKCSACLLFVRTKYFVKNYFLASNFLKYQMSTAKVLDSLCKLPPPPHPCIHCQPFEEENRKTATFKMLSFCQNIFLSVSNKFIQKCYISQLCKQGIRMFLKTIWKELNSSYKRYI